MVPTLSDVEPIIRNWNKEKFGQWLYDSLRNYHIKKKGRFSFKPFHTFFCYNYHITEEFFAFYSVLPDRKKAVFRAGLAIALEKTGIDFKKNEQIFEDILTMARKTNSLAILSVIKKNIIPQIPKKKISSELLHSISWTYQILKTEKEKNQKSHHSAPIS